MCCPRLAHDACSERSHRPVTFHFSRSVLPTLSSRHRRRPEAFGNRVHISNFPHTQSHVGRVFRIYGYDDADDLISGDDTLRARRAQPASSFDILQLFCWYAQPATRSAVDHPQATSTTREPLPALASHAESRSQGTVHRQSYRQLPSAWPSWRWSKSTLCSKLSCSHITITTRQSCMHQSNPGRSRITAFACSILTEFHRYPQAAPITLFAKPDDRGYRLEPLSSLEAPPALTLSCMMCCI